MRDEILKALRSLVAAGALELPLALENGPTSIFVATGQGRLVLRLARKDGQIIVTAGRWLVKKRYYFDCSELG